MPKRSTISVECHEKLIELVREHTVLYDQGSRFHNNADVLRDTWAGIADIIGIPGKDGLAIKKVWRNLRDSYVKKRKAGKTCGGQAIGSIYRWKYMDLMSFLDNFIEDESFYESNVPDHSESHGPGEAEDQSSRDHQNPSSDDDMSDAGSFRPIKLEQQLFVPSGSSHDEGWGTGTPNSSTANNQKKPSTFSAKPPKKKQKTEDNSEADLNGTLKDFIAEHKRNSQMFREQFQQPPSQKSVEECFFDTCVLRMQKLPEAMKSLLQLQISQLFFNAENPNLVPVTITTSPPQQLFPSNS